MQQYKPAIPDTMLAKWQRLINAMVLTLGASDGLIMRLVPPALEVCVASTPAGRFAPGDRIMLDSGDARGYGLSERWMLQFEHPGDDPGELATDVLDADAARDPGGVPQLGVLLVWPDGDLFGTLCAWGIALETAPTRTRELMHHFRETVESDLHMLDQMQRMEQMQHTLRKNRELLDNILASSPAGIMALHAVRDPHNLIIDFEWELVNAVAERVLRRPANALIGLRLREELPAPQAAELFALFRQVVISGEPLDHEYHVEHGGVSMWLRMIAVRRDDGVSVTFVDITRIKRTERDLREQRRFVQQIADNAPYAIYVYDLREQCSVYANRYAIESADNITTTLAAAGVPDALEAICHPDDHDTWRDLAARVLSLRDDDVVTAEFRMRDTAGNVWRWMQAWIVVFRRAPDGSVWQALGMLLDITDLKQAQAQALRFTLEQEKVRLLTSFIRDLSHEFRTPLSTIRTSAYMLRRMHNEPQFDHRLEEYATQIDSQTRTITQLVEDLLVMSRLDGGLDIVREPCDLNLAVERAMQKKLRDATERGVRLALDLAPKLPALNADGDYLHDAIVRLVENAISFTSAGGEVTLRTRRRGDTVLIVVQDTGVGMDEHTLPHIFDRFYRHDSARTTHGAGLGLSIAQRVVELHGGAIGVESEPGRGSCFTIRLPLPSETV